MRPKKTLIIPSLDDDDLEEELADLDDSEDGRPTVPAALVSQFIRMWPRSIFSKPAKDGSRKTIAMTIPELMKPGVYILYRDDVPFYVGQTKYRLRTRLRAHASSVNSPKSYFWNYFSAFIVESPSHIDEVEAILISAMPAVITNSSTPRFERVVIGEPTRRLIRELRDKGNY